MVDNATQNFGRQSLNSEVRDTCSTPGLTQTLCRICGDKIGDHKRKLDTNRFVSEIQQIWKDLLLLDSPNIHPQIKNKKQRKEMYVNDVLLCSLNTDNLGFILTLQVRKLTKKAPDV